MFSTFEFADHVFGILIKSDMDEKLFQEMRELINRKIEAFEKISIFLEIEKGNEISVRALAKHLKFNVEHRGHFYKIAVVTDKGWARNVAAIKDLLIPAEVKAFSHSERVEAMRWIAE